MCYPSIICCTYFYIVPFRVSLKVMEIRKVGTSGAAGLKESRSLSISLRNVRNVRQFKLALARREQSREY